MSKNIPYFLRNGGEMGELTRQFDWSLTPLGPPDRWPQSLRITVAMILSSKFPMFLWWGDELIQFYNDAYRPSLGNNGKHPLALGQRGMECWPEIWELIYPLILQVRMTGNATWSEDQLVPIYRNGSIEDVYWTFGYSPITGETEKVEGVLVVCTETTEKVINLRHLADSKKELEFAIEAAELGTWDLNPLTNHFTANTRLKGWFGLQPWEEIPLQFALDAMAEKDRKRVALAIKYALNHDSGGLYDIEYTIIHPHTKKERIVRAKGKAFFNEEGIAYRFNGTLQDITEQKNTEAIQWSAIEEVVTERTKALAEANSNLQRSNAELGQFAYIASHDLQEPLRKVSTFSEMLEHSLGKIDERSRSYLDKINASTARMLKLIRDVLAYSQLSKENEAFERVSLQQVINGIKSDFDLLIDQKKAKINYLHLPTIEAIPLQMSQLFGNLVSNALKFSKPETPPEIRINATVLSGEEAGWYPFLNRNLVYYRIEFSDNGIGFPQEYAEKIFHIFQRLHGKTGYAGTGIGLAMCKKNRSKPSRGNLCYR